MSDDEPRYRVGRHLGRTIYDGDRLIGMMDTPELGAEVVDALNARHRVLAYREEHYLRDEKPSNLDRCDRATGHHSTPHRGCVLR